MQDNQDFLDNVGSEIYKAARNPRQIEYNKNRRGASFEDRVMRFILTRLNLGAEVTRLSRIMRERTGESRLNFRLFKSFWPDFPLELKTIKTSGQASIRLFSFLNKKERKNIAIYKEFNDLRNQTEYGSCGVVFEVLNSGIERGLWLLHDHPLMDINEDTTVFGDKVFKKLYLQPLSQFLTSLAWFPKMS